jgi:phage terminase large subunit-like protein
MGKRLNDDEFREYVNSILDNQNTTPDEKLELYELVKRRNEYRKYNALDYYIPHEWQRKFLDAGKHHRYRFISCGNRLGKTLSGCYEVAYHATGRYPWWWQGRRFYQPIDIWEIGITADSTRIALQKNLIGTDNVKGDCEKLDSLGTGTIPKDCIIVSSMQKDGNRLESFRIKHYDRNGVYDGDSTITFKSCSQGVESLRGATLHLVHLDETSPNDPLDYYGELHARVRTTKGLVLVTASPEDGETDLVIKFQNSEAKEEYYQEAGIYDSPLYTDEEREQMILETPEYLRPAKLFGSPKASSGAVFPFDFDSMVLEQPFPIPNDWLHVAALDTGWSDPTVCTWIAMSPEKVFYVYDTYGEKEQVPAIHAQAIKTRGKIPLVLAQDSLKKEAGTGQALYKMYKDLLPDQVQNETFYNFKSPVTGAMNNSRRDGFDLMRTIMREGRLKFFPTCTETIRQIKNYRAVNGKVQEKGGDDYVDSLRYALLSCEKRGATKGIDTFFANNSYESSWKPYNRYS